MNWANHGHRPAPASVATSPGRDPDSNAGADGQSANPLRSVGVFSNRYLLGGIAFALAFAAALNNLFGTAPLTAGQLATVLPFPFIVWGADELRRLLMRRHAAVTAS